MFGDIKVPFNSVMLYNVAKLKEGVTLTDVEEHLGTMCNIVKNKYKGFLAGQVFEYAGFVSAEGSVGDYGAEGNHIAIITYWTSFEEHERSHADTDFKNEFCKLLEFCEDTKELGYKLMWQGEQELDNVYKETVEIDDRRFIEAKRFHITPEGKRYPVITQEELDKLNE